MDIFVLAQKSISLILNWNESFPVKKPKPDGDPINEQVKCGEKS